jgi:hypothetical protein
MHPIKCSTPGDVGAPHGGDVRKNDQLRQAIYPHRTISDVRLQYLVARLHALGPRPIYELLREVAAGADLFGRLQIYARLEPDIVRALGADVLAIDYFSVIDGDAL